MPDEDYLYAMRLTAVQPNTDNARPVKVGDRIPVPLGSGVGILRVMAIADGYAMCRFPGAIPHVRSLKKLNDLPAARPDQEHQ